MPLVSLAGNDGVLYTFAAEDSSQPLLVEFAMEPQAPGVFHQEVRTDPAHDLFLNAITLP